MIHYGQYYNLLLNFPIALEATNKYSIDFNECFTLKIVFGCLFAVVAFLIHILRIPGKDFD